MLSDDDDDENEIQEYVGNVANKFVGVDQYEGSDDFYFQCIKYVSKYMKTQVLRLVFLKDFVGLILCFKTLLI